MRRLLKIFCFWLLSWAVAINGIAQTDKSPWANNKNNYSCTAEGVCKEVLKETRQTLGASCSTKIKDFFQEIKEKGLLEGEDHRLEKLFNDGRAKKYPEIYSNLMGQVNFTAILLKVKDNDNYLKSEDYSADCKKMVDEFFIKKDKDSENEAVAKIINLNTDKSHQSLNEIYSKCFKENSGVLQDKRLKTCDETSGLLDKKENTDIMTLLSSMSFPINESDFYVLASERYCSKCYKKKLKVVDKLYEGDKGNNRSEKDVEKELIEELAKGKIEASFYKLSNYMESLARLANLNDKVKSEEYYCIQELEEALSADDCNNAVGKKRFEEVAKKLGFCSGETCRKEKALSIFNAYKNKIETRPGHESNGCYKLEQIQLKDTTAIALLSDISKYLFQDPFTGNLFSTKKEEIEKEYPNARPWQIMTKTIISMVSSSEVKNKDLIDRIDAIMSGAEKEEDKEKKLGSLFWKSFKELPELAAVFQNPKLFNETFDSFLNQSKSKDFVGYINQNLIEKEAKVTKNRFDYTKQKACKKFKEELKEGVCLNKDNYLNGTFSSVDIANTTKKLATLPDGDDLGMKKEDVIKNIHLASLSCSMRNEFHAKGEKESKLTISSDPLEYIKYPNDYIYAYGNGGVLKSRDKVTKAGNHCETQKKENPSFKALTLTDRINILFITSSNDLNRDNLNNVRDKVNTHTTEESMAIYEDVEAKNTSEEMYATNNYQNDSYICYGGNCENTSLGNKGGGASKRVSDFNAANNTASTNTSSSGEGNYSEFEDNNNSTGTYDKETFTSETTENTNEIVNPFAGITGSGGNDSYLPQAPSYSPYIATGGQENNALSQEDIQSRNNAIGDISSKFPGAFSPEQLSALSSDDLQKLLAYADEKSSEEKAKLEQEKAKLELEKAAFEKEKIQAEIKKLQEEKEQLLAENKLQKKGSEEEEISSPLLGTKKETNGNRYETEKPIISNIAQGADNFNKAIAGGELSNESYSAGSSQATTGHAGSNAMRGGTTGATIALLKEYKSSYYDGASDASVSQVVDNYLNYVRSNNVSTSEIIKRNSNGELIEILIPNNKGELVSLDISKLSPEEREKLEKKVEDLVALEKKKEKIERKIASAPDSKIQDIDEKISRLNNELQESYLDDLKQNILQALISSQE